MRISTPFSFLEKFKSHLKDERGGALIEFVFIAPVMITIYIGTFQICDAVSAHRKVTLAMRTVADLTSQQSGVSTANLTTFLNASAQVMTPYSTTNLQMTVTEVCVGVYTAATTTTSATCTTSTATPAPQTIVISQGYNTTALTTIPSNYVENGYNAAGTALNSPVVAANHMAQNGQSYVVAAVNYTYVPVIPTTLFGNIAMSDSMAMVPRNTSLIVPE
jgi:Flp pilus assembly protein TadG